MIIVPAAFVLSEAAAGQPLSNPRIGYHTHTRDDDVIVTASTETEAGPKENPLEPSTPGFWQASAMPATWTLDLGATRSIDYLGIAEHTIGSQGVAAKVETSMGDTEGSPPVQIWTALASDVAPADDAPLIFLDDVRDARFVRVTVTGTVAPKLGVIYTGLILAMTRPPEMGYEPLTMSRVTELHSAMSRGGQFLGQGIKKMGVQSSISFQRLRQDWVRESFQPFVKAARQFPYFFAWRPADFPLEVGYVWTRDDIRVSYSEWDFFSASWNMEGIGQE